MNNVFENAYFGKAYKTRDGSKAIFICKRTDNAIWGLSQPFACVVEGYGEIWNYYPNGRLYRIENFTTESDIVSEWQDEIDEEKLSKLAWKHAESMDIPCRYEETAVESFKAGYKKAKAE